MPVRQSLLLGIERGRNLLEEGDAVTVTDPETSVGGGKQGMNVKDGVITCQFEKRFKLQPIEAIEACRCANPEKSICRLGERVYDTAEPGSLIAGGTTHLLDGSIGIWAGSDQRRYKKQQKKQARRKLPSPAHQTTVGLRMTRLRALTMLALRYHEIAATRIECCPSHGYGDQRYDPSSLC
jgi:hypothetical protein